jgi:hypothetical protein
MPEPVLRRAGTAAVARCPCGVAGRHPTTSTPDEPEHDQFLFMQRAFGPSGGLISGDGLGRLLRVRAEQPLSMLARWIVRREVVAVDWRSCTMLPLFQFEPCAMTIRPRVTDVVKELTGVFDGWSLALWFAQPNAWLEERAPVDVIHLDPRTVLDAARADRFIARG